MKRKCLNETKLFVTEVLTDIEKRAKVRPNSSGGSPGSVEIGEDVFVVVCLFVLLLAK